MSKLIYKFDYDYHKAEVSFEVDTEVFTERLAKLTLEFFTWDYDEDEDPVKEVMCKYALEAIREATFHGYNATGVIGAFGRKEGYCPLDGSKGIKLVGIEGFEFEDGDLDLHSVEEVTID